MHLLAVLAAMIMANSSCHRTHISHNSLFFIAVILSRLLARWRSPMTVGNPSLLYFKAADYLDYLLVMCAVCACLQAAANGFLRTTSPRCKVVRNIRDISPITSAQFSES